MFLLNPTGIAEGVCDVLRGVGVLQRVPGADPITTDTAIVVGTGVVEKVGIFRLADMGYSRARQKLEGNVALVVTPRGGIGSLSRSYPQVREILDELSEGGPINLLGHSQGSAHVLRYTAERPERVLVCATLGGPNAGSWLGSWFVSLFAALPHPIRYLTQQTLGAAVDLARGSEYLETEVRDRVDAMLRRSDLTVRPHIVCLGVGGERLVQGHSPFLFFEGVHNVWIGRATPIWLRSQVRFREVDHDPRHIGCIRDDVVLEEIAAAFAHGPIAVVRRSRRRTLVAAAA